MENIAVIFDMDGVIIDSNPLITSGWTSFFLRHGINITNDQLKNYVYGRTARDTLSLIFEREIDENSLAAYISEVADQVRELYVSEGKIIPGLPSLIDDLKSNLIPLGLATSGSPEDVKVVLGIANLVADFSIILDSSTTHQPKPNPEVYLRAAKLLNTVPGNCCVFEDSFPGIAAAKAAGMKVIGVTSTYSKAELKDLVDHTVSDFTEINSDMIKKILNSSSCIN